MSTQNELGKVMLPNIFINNSDRIFYEHDDIVEIVKESCTFRLLIFYTFNDNFANMI